MPNTLLASVLSAALGLTFASSTALAAPLPQFAVTEADVDHESCPTRGPASVADIKANLAKIPSKVLATATVHGLILKNQSDVMVRALRTLTTAIGDENGISTSFRQLHLNYRTPKCKSVSCVIESLFGVEAGWRTLYLYLRHGLNTSRYVWPYGDAWRLEDYDTMFGSVMDLPKSLRPFRNQQLSRYLRNHRPFSALLQDGLVADDTIQVFDYFEELPSGLQRYALFHEFAHRIGVPLEKDTEWAKISGWTGSGDHAKITSPNLMVSNRGSFDPFEDIAESIAAYRYRGQDLKRRAPLKYEKIKSVVFKGFEFYSDPTLCGAR